MVIIFVITVFLAAALLFGVQPMVAKTLLPIFGGGSSVWTTCMLFFQSILIAGYLYAHLLLTRVPRKIQFIIHGTVIAAALVVGWIFSDPIPPPGASEFPVPWLLGQLFLIAGLPYFAISSAGPLLQGWFARTGHARAHDPYFLYAASNAGSFIGLLAYPFVFEPTLGLNSQRALWLGLFATFGALAFVCLRKTRQDRFESLAAAVSHRDKAEAITWKRRFWWMFLAFVPSSTLLSITTHITTDVASFPLLWVIPLSLYLLTMILAFSGRSAYFVKGMARPMVLAVIAALVLLVAWASSEQMAPLGANMGVQFAVLFTVGLYGHARLALDRPDASRLTEYFLVISVGGALGGLFNGILAPLAFSSDYEYQITLVLALLMLPGRSRSDGVTAARYWARRLTIPLASLACYGAAILLTPILSKLIVSWFGGEASSLKNTLAGGVSTVILLIWLVPPGILIYMGWRDRVSSAGALIFPLIGVILTQHLDPRALYLGRTFFGIHLVERSIDITGVHVLHSLIHGTTKHGLQLVDDPDRASKPLGYYHIDGPCGSLMRALHTLRPESMRITVIGLGTGAMVAHGRPDDRIVFMDVDPAVARIAQDTRFFTYLSDAKADFEIRLGDGRLLLERSEVAGEPPFDAIFVDAFSSDSIPTHLLTREAMELYFRRIAPDGFIALHISNRHLNLRPLVNTLADLEGSYSLVFDDRMTDEVGNPDLRLASVWMVLTKNRDTGHLLLRQGFSIDPSPDRIRPWTDQYSNLLSVLNRK